MDTPNPALKVSPGDRVMMALLLQCPCGGTAEILNTVRDGQPAYYAHCSGCGRTGFAHRHPVKAATCFKNREAQ